MQNPRRNHERRMSEMRERTVRTCYQKGVSDHVPNLSLRRSLDYQEGNKMKVLLVEPYYPRSEPPLGLMKLSTWHKQQGREVKFIRGTDPFGTELGDWKPDAIDITT